MYRNIWSISSSIFEYTNHLEPSPLFAHRACPTSLKCKIVYLMLRLGKETAVQAIVGSIVWAFRRLNKRRCREMSARGYALHSVCPKFPFFQLNSCRMPGPVAKNVGMVEGSRKNIYSAIFVHFCLFYERRKAMGCKSSHS